MLYLMTQMGMFFLRSSKNTSALTLMIFSSFFPQETLKNLRDQVVNISPAKGGFLVFTDYENDLRDYVSVFLIRDTIGMLFKMDKGKSSFTINPAEHLDLDKLAMACKIDITKYKQDSGKYLSFIKRKMEEYLRVLHKLDCGKREGKQ